MSSIDTPDPLVHILSLLKLRYGILVNQCQATTGWSSYAGTVTIATAAKVVGPTNAAREDDYKEEGSYNIEASGTASAGGSFTIAYTPSSSINFSGTAAEEFQTGWLTYFSAWIKTPKAGTFQIKLVDSSARTAYWNLTVTAGAQKYYHNVIGTYTAHDTGFDITSVASMRFGYTGRTANEAGMEFRVDGPRVQGDPTFDSYGYWGTAPLDDTMVEQCMVVNFAEAFPPRHGRVITMLGDIPIHFDLGPQPTILRRVPVRIGYQMIADPDNKKSQGRARNLRFRAKEETYRILSKYTTDLQSKGITFIYYEEHEMDDDFSTTPIRLRGFHSVRCHMFGNVHGAV
jgi:hypothetical protein